MTRPRTIVGSHPHRRALPMGREAVERALRLVCWWGGTPDEASVRAARSIPWANRNEYLNIDGPAWLPAELFDVTRTELEAMLAEMDEPAEVETLEDLASELLDARRCSPR